MAKCVRLAEGREAEVFLWADGTVLKLMRDPLDEPRVRREAAALSALAQHGHTAPAPLETVSVDGRPGLVMERITGVDLLEQLGRRPWSVLKAGQTIGEAHAGMHDCVAPAELPDLHDELRGRIEVAGPLDERLRSAVLLALDSLPRGDRLCHGDLHFANMLGSWSAPVIIDWGNATRGDPIADVARTRLLLGFGETPPGAPTLIRLLAPVCRDAVISRYLDTYRKRRPLERALLERWEIVQAAARLSEGVTSEHPKLLHLIRQRLHRFDE